MHKGNKINALAYRLKIEIRELCRPYLTFYPPLDIYSNNVVTLSLEPGRLEIQVYRKSACACVFNIQNRLMTTSNDSTTCRKGTGRCCKKFCLAFSLVNISFSKNCVYLAYDEF